MTTAYSTNLGLALPVEGELSGTWGDMVNNGITDYLDIAVAGTLTLNGDGAVTLTDTNGDTTSTNIGSTTAQYAVLKITGTLTTTKVITAPSHSKTYIVDNSATGGTVTLKASGQTGISVAVGEKCTAYFNGTDYVKIASSVADGVTSVGGTGTVNGISLSGTVTSTGNLTLGGALTGVDLTTQVTGTLPVANGGTGIATATAYSVVFTGTTSTGAFQASAGPGTATYVLTSNGPGALPTFQAPAASGITTGKSIAMAMIFGF